jgi:hypothetical protein
MKMGDLIKQIGLLFVNSVSSDVTPEERRVAHAVLVKIGWRVAVIGALLWGFGWLAFFGLGGGFARADDVKLKISEATQPLKKSVEELTNLVNRSLAEAKAAEIRALVYKRCKTADYGDKESINKEIDRKQDEYRSLRVVTYQEPRCDQVM